MNESESLRARDDERIAALLAADLDALEEILADSLDYVHSSGAVDTKESYLRSIAAGKVRYESIVRHRFVPTVRGEMAYAVSILEIVASVDGKRVEVGNRVLDVWVEDSGKWRLAARSAALHDLAGDAAQD